jgi:hypothetical protein
MSSSGPSEPLDLDGGLPVTPADVAAQRAARERTTPMTLSECLTFLSALPPLTFAEQKARRGPRGEPFVLSF